MMLFLLVYIRLLCSVAQPGGRRLATSHSNYKYSIASATHFYIGSKSDCYRFFFSSTMQWFSSKLLLFILQINITVIFSQ